MDRRRFLGVMGLGASCSLAFPRFSSAIPRFSTDSADKPAPTRATAYGSGHFGEWIWDEFGLPAYNYSCDQIADARAVSPVHTEWRGPSDHTHQVGNDRIVALVSNYGYVQVRQDEGAPKLLNDYFPPDRHYGGGIGFLIDDDSVSNTYYSGRRKSFERILGMGYLRKRLTDDKHGIDQVICAPFGDDPVLLSQVTITNLSEERQELGWVEYWGCCNYQLSFRSSMEASALKEPLTAPKLRRSFARQFAHEFRKTRDGAGLIETQRFLGRTPEEESAWLEVQTQDGGSAFQLAAGASIDDLAPPPTFLVSLDGPPTAYATDVAKIFAEGIEHAFEENHLLDNSLSASGAESAFFLERRFSLDAGQSRTLYFLYGYVPEGFELDGLVDKYAADPAGDLARSCSQWRQDGIRFRVGGQDWVERETGWHNYYVRSAATFDSFFQEHIISQGQVYQYLMGFQGAARDPLQHVLPLVFSNPGLVREVIRYTLKEVQQDGSIPYALVGCGVPLPGDLQPSDQEMWLLWLVSEYVLATRDKEFLNERLPTYPRKKARSADMTVGQLLARSYSHLVESIGVGKHGLMRLMMGDWNDNVVVGHVPKSQAMEVRQRGESVLNAAMACYVFDYYAELLRAIGDKQGAEDAHQKAKLERNAVREQWAGRWFRRAWLGDSLGWIGDDQVWLEPQPWTIIGGGATGDQARKLVHAMDKLLRKPSPIGALILAGDNGAINERAGEMENGGIWASINGTLIWALAQIDGSMAWDEWQKNSLARHAETYPDVWYGIWSGPDNYNSVLSRFPGQTMFGTSPDNTKPSLDPDIYWTDFPVMNVHSHAWQLYSVTKLLGIEFNHRGVRFKPDLPLSEFDFASPLLGFKKTEAGYSGWYDPIASGEWKIDIQLSATELARVREVKINGVAKFTPPLNQSVQLNGTSYPGKPLRWQITWKSNAEQITSASSRTHP